MAGWLQYPSVTLNSGGFGMEDGEFGLRRLGWFGGVLVRSVVFVVIVITIIVMTITTIVAIYISINFARNLNLQFGYG